MNDSVIWNVLRSEEPTIPIKVERAGEVRTFPVAPFKSETRGWRRKSVRQIMILPAQTPLIDQVQPDSPAAAAGLKHGDVVVGFNGTHIYHPLAVADYIEAHPNQPMTLQVNRDGAVMDVTVLPKILSGGKVPRVGIQWEANGRMSVSHPNPIEQVYNSVTSTLNTIGAVASPKSDVKLQHLSGPIGIGRIYYLLFQSESGWQLALWFSVILNVNLAILNMLPIPVLDGGHIVLAIIESIRRKPVNMRLLELIQTGCAVLIIGYMLYVTFYDAQDLPFIRNKLDKMETQPAPAKPTPAP
jgi:regulator of sigma E protease